MRRIQPQTAREINLFNRFVGIQSRVQGASAPAGPSTRTKVLARDDRPGSYQCGVGGGSVVFSALAFLAAMALSTHSSAAFRSALRASGWSHSDSARSRYSRFM